MERIRMSKRSIGVAVAIATVLGAASIIVALRPSKPGAPTRRARKIVAGLRAMPGSPLRFDFPENAPPPAEHPAPEAEIPEARHPVNVTLPDRSTEPLRVEDGTTQMAVAVQPRDVFNVAAQSADGYYVYPHAHSSGGTLLHRQLEDGAEDFVSFETRPAKPEVAYDVTLTGVHAVRLVEGTLEFLDAGGAPRLRAAPPYIVGADGERTDATVAVENCTVDTDPAPPWGRDIPPPNSDSCTLRIRWNDGQVRYPAVLDPRWSSTGSMTSARQDFTATMMSTGKILAVGGRSSSTSTTGLATAEVFDPATSTWAATASLTGTTPGRYLHTAVQLGSTSSSTTTGRVFVAGGTNGGASLNTAQLYSPSAGTWLAATNLNVARHGATATLLSNGNVLLAGGLSGTTVQNTAAVYNPSSGGGAYTATGTMPQAVKFHTATLLKVSGNSTLNNKVLVVGGNSGTASVTNVQLFDGMSTWSSLTALSNSREGHTATALTNGNVLVAGGRSGSSTLNTTLLFNAGSGSGTWSTAGTLNAARQLHTATLLPSAIVENGQVLVAGGSSGSAALTSAEVWNGTTTWTTTSALPSALQGQTATLLNNNLVLLAGGSNNGTSAVATSAFFDGSFALQCTSNSQCATGFCVSGVCCDTACNGGCGVCNLAGHVGTCSAASSGTVCRAQAGACDAAETCNGTSLTCPTDAVAPLGSVCRPANGACDVPETCDGTTKACPTDGFAAATTVCRASTGTCDAAETCTGTSAACPADGFAAAGTVCRPSAGGCDAAETCTGGSPSCPADSVAPAGTVCRPAESICDVAETCDGSSSACPNDAFAAAGTACGAATGNSSAPVCSGATATCPVAGGTSDVLGFEVPADWSLDVSDSGTTAIVGSNANRTQGASSLEVTAQNYARFNSTPVGSIGSVGPLVLLDVLLPTDQPNPNWYGDAQMFVNSPTLGLFNVFLTDVPMTGLALGTWQTLAFQMPASAAQAIAGGVYADLTFSVVLNVPYNSTGHYLIDNIRSIPDVVPSLLGVAQDGATLKAIFDYQTTSSTPVNIPYGTANGLTNQNGFIATPPEAPPTTFVAATHAPFVATLSGARLTWTVGSHSVTATPSSQQLPVTTLPDGTHDVPLPDGRKVNIDSVPPANPPVTPDPPVAGPYFGSLIGKLGVSPSGAATYTVPISIPPGMAGMAPNLSLTYSSQGKDGMAGQGWDLTGTSMIHLCPKTRIQDGIAQPIKMVDTDQNITDGVCLDGQRLLETTPGTYKLENEDFSTITRTPTGPRDTTFTVVTKAGQRRYYGLHPTTRVVLPSFAVPDSNPTSVWLLDRVVDQWGNYYDLHYDYDDTTRFPFEGAYLTSINYTGHLTTVDGDPTFPSFPGTNVAPPNVISFAYETRPDPRLIRFHYATLQIAKRLTGITTPQGTYTLGYLPDDPLLPSRLGTISYCNGPTSLSTAPSTACLDALTFTWDAGNYGWQQAPDPTVSGQDSSYALPVGINQQNDSHGQPVLSGVRLADLDGDGRVDLVVSRDANGLYSASHHVWWNNGQGWSAKDDWNLPASLADSAGKTGAFLVDVDGDGLPDLVSKNAQGKPTIWYNRIKTHLGWIADTGPLTSSFPSTWGSLAFHVDDPTTSTIDSVLDINGDGKADIVRQWPNNGEIDVLLNAPSGWVAADYTIPEGFAATNADAYTFSDVNRDGLADLVNSAGVISSSPTIINTGKGGNTSTTSTWQIENTNITLPSYDPTEQRAADIDGDGYYDVAEDDTTVGAAVVFGTGTDYSPYTIYPSPPNFGGFFGAYVGTLQAYDSAPGFGRTAGPVTLADLNGDGLADAIMSQSPAFTGNNTVELSEWGQVLINGGPGNGWRDPTGAQGPVKSPSTFSVPFVPSPRDPTQGGAFIDLNGDGLADIVHATDGGVDGPGSAVTAAWLNTFHPPIIKQFPVGLAAPTKVCYATITTADAQKPGGAYDDSVPLAANTTYMASPLRVVTSTTSDAGLKSDGTGQKVTTTYSYEALRGSAFGRGPQGFHSVITTDPSGIVTTTTYAQAYPYTGMPTSVTKAYDVSDGGPPLIYSTSATLYCALPSGTPGQLGDNPACAPQTGQEYAPGTTLFVYPFRVTDATTLESGTTADRTTNNPETVVTTNNVYDSHGNPTTTIVQTDLDTPTEHGPPTVETWISTTTNKYGDDASDEQLQGKVTKTTVTTQQVEPVAQAARTHTTEFGYQAISSFFPTGQEHFLLAMHTKTVEPGAGYPIELDTTFSYDSFGNVTSTTTCDNGVGGCRTATASYDPTDFVAPPGSGLITSIGYQPGLFPVRQTNAAGQTQYFVYDVVHGNVLQHTDPNGITICSTYDSFGNPVSTIERCGSTSPVTTTISRFRATGFAQPAQEAAAVVAVSRPQSGAATWTYTDTIGRAVETLARNLNGGLTETDTNYDPLGRVLTRTPATLVGDEKLPTEYDYDGLSRIVETHQPLGNIDGSGLNTFAFTFTSYQGPSVITKEVVHGENQQRTETKNAVGKIASVTDAAGQVIRYQYDSDGNLTDAGDPIGGSIPTVHTGYDTDGRKTRTVDPDMGTWQYCYDGFGDLVKQIDSQAGNSTCTSGTPTTTMTYDSLGRMTSRTDSSGTAQWLYDSAPGAGIGKLAATAGAPDANLEGACPLPAGFTVVGGNRAVKQYSYDQFGAVQEVDECADGDTFATTYQYDPLGRQSLIRYPAVKGSQLAVGYHYTNLGFLQYLTDESSDYSVLWQAKATDALGQITDGQMGNGVETIASRNPVTGWLMSSSSTAHADGNTLIQSWTNTFDEVGNLRTRTRSDVVNDVPSAEIFTYDVLNRLKTSEVQLPTLTPTAYDQTDNYFYDALGNLTQKGSTMYTYGIGCVGPAGPHAVCTVGGGTPYTYDANGNMTSGGGRSVTYNATNKPIDIVSDGPSGTSVVDFAYDAAGNRVLQIVNSPSETSRTVYAGLGETGKSLYERTTKGGIAVHTFFIYAGAAHGGNAFAVRVLDDNGIVAAKNYFNFDHLGSTTAVSDERGHVTTVASAGPAAGVLGYDPWGARRNPDGRTADPMSFQLAPGHREFTGQETIPAVELVNMNGRVYDPVLGRFLSPDPNVQTADDLQSYNRYSYVLNNPLRYTDPTGYFSWGSFEAALPGVFLGLMGAAACIGTSGVGCALIGIATALMTSTVARIEGASWAQVGTGFIIGAISGNIGGSAGSLLGNALGAEAGTAADFAAAEVGGAVGGAIGGALSTWVTGGGSLGTNVLFGAVQGAAWAAVGWGAKQPSPLTKADQGEKTGQDASHPQPRSFHNGVVSSRIPVPDEDGGLGGYIDVRVYQARTGGVVIDLAYTSLGGDVDLNWVQTVSTNTPINGNEPQFVDNANGGGTNYYMSPEQAERVSEVSGYAADFTDSPGRVGRYTGLPTPNVTWSAETSLVSMTDSTILTTLNWGFSTNAAGQVSMLPLTVSEPSPFQLQAIATGAQR